MAVHVRVLNFWRMMESLVLLVKKWLHIRLELLRSSQILWTNDTYPAVLYLSIILLGYDK
jgi:hypothetical protein